MGFSIHIPGTGITWKENSNAANIIGSGVQNYAQAVLAPTESALNLLQGKDPLAPFAQGLSNLKDPFGISGRKKNVDAENAAIKARQDLIAKIKGDTGLDQISRDELLKQVQSGKDVTANYADALLGKGVYGNRKANEQYAKLLADTPGQKQLFLSNQQRVSAGQSMFNPIGTQAGALLTGGQR